MRTEPIGPDALAASVFAVPPLARTEDLAVAPGANASLLRYVESGGITSVLYGGNANFYHVGGGEYAELVDQLADAAGPDTWILPSIGPDYGKALDQVDVLKNRAFPTTMLLPMTFPYSAEGLLNGIRRITDAYGRPVIVYIKTDNYLSPNSLAGLVAESRVCGIKYAVPRPDLLDDPYLDALTDTLGREMIVSGNGERPILAHMINFGLAGYTSGSVCLAPAISKALLQALQDGDEQAAGSLREKFMPLEDIRDELGQIAVLHEAVTLAGIADMGPMLPMMTNPTESDRARIRPVVERLMSDEAEYRAAGAV